MGEYTLEDLKQHCKKTVDNMEMFDKELGRDSTHTKVYQEHKLVLDLIEENLELKANNYAKTSNMLSMEKDISELRSKLNRITGIYLKWNQIYDYSTSEAWSELIEILEER